MSGNGLGLDDSPHASERQRITLALHPAADDSSEMHDEIEIGSRHAHRDISAEIVKAPKRRGLISQRLQKIGPVVGREPRGKVVNHADIPAVTQQTMHEMSPNETAAAGDERFHCPNRALCFSTTLASLACTR